MADKVDIKTLLENIVLIQGGKVVAGKPKSDNYAVHPKDGSALALMPGQEILRVLQEAFPGCVFTYFAEPVKAEPAKADADKK